MGIGKKIKLLRKALLDMNQQQFGMAVETLIIGEKKGFQKYISRIETDERSPTLIELQAIAKVLKVRISDLSLDGIDIQALIAIKKSL